MNLKNKHESSDLNVRMCGCGAVSVTFGKISLHLDKDEFETFADKVGKAREVVAELNAAPAFGTVSSMRH